MFVMKHTRLGVLLLAAAVLLGGGPVSALAVPSAPSLERPIVDQTNTLSESEIQSLSVKITSSRGDKDYQVGVLMIPRLDNESIEEYSIKVAREWGIGQKGENNGVLLLVAKDDRQLRIEVGSGLEGDLTDAQSGRIIRDVITPQFRQGNYYMGISNGLESIAATVSKQPDPHAAPVLTGWQNFWNIAMQGGVFFIFAFLWLSSILARSKSWWAGGILGAVVGVIVAVFAGWVIWSVLLLVGLAIGGLGLDWVVSRNYRDRASHGEAPSWWAGGTHLGGGLGGGGFGGGGFSGGGSSGSW
jgi:uncharacterized protein